MKIKELEQSVAEIISSVIKADSFGKEDLLSTYGLSSLSAIKMATLLFKKFDIQIKPQQLVKEGSQLMIVNMVLENLLGNRVSDNGSQNAKGYANIDNKGLIQAPLTFPQVGVFIDCLKNPGTTQYNIPSLFTFPASVNAEDLSEALKSSILNHQSFRLTFNSNGEETMQVFNPDMAIEIPVRQLTAEEFEKEKQFFVKPFNLRKGPLFRFEIITVPSEQDSLYLFTDFHHLIFDGSSIDLFIKEVISRLNKVHVEKEDYPYISFAAEQKSAEGQEEFQNAKAFFQERLSTCEGASEVTMDLPASTEKEHLISSHSLELAFDDVEQLAKGRGVTPMSIFLAAVYYTVSRYVNNKQVYIATISNGRSNLRTYNTTGMFVNTLALSAEIKDQTVMEFIKETSDNFIKTIEHEQYPFAQIAADYGLKPEIVFEYQIGVADEYRINGKKILKQHLTLDIAKFKIKIAIESADDGNCKLDVKYDRSIYTSGLIEGFAESVKATLEHFLSQPDGLLKHISIMSPRQAEEVEKMHTVATSEIPFTRFYEPIEYWAEKTPDNKAVIACDRTLTFREFNQECNRIARSLIARGVKRGDRIILLLPRTSAILCSMFGVSKAGAAYIPCDPAYPTERIKLILEDSGAKYVITTEEYAAEHGEKALLVDELMSSPECPECLENPGVLVSPDDLAYLIYTSGSTGRPKGVMLRHYGICNYLYNHPENRHIHALVTEGVKAYLCITTLSFDMSLKEFGVALHNGITAVLANEDEVNNPILLAKLFRKTGAQAINGTPSRLLGYMESEDFCQELSKCKVVMSGGEKYSDKLLERLNSMNLRFFNTYGPTEITVSSNCMELTGKDYISIGRPLLNYTEFVVDADGNELPVGVVGELYIGGPGVALGYNNLDKQTKDHFVEYGGMRVYKSGDYARWRRNGEVDILGRLDNQVKLNGLRIELGEVESAISKVQGIKQTTVLIRNIDGRDHLSAYFVADRKIDIEEMKVEIGGTLTHYMVPTAYLQMDKFPLTPNGKTDVKNLPMPEIAKVGGEYVAPVSQAEKDFCEAFEQILNLEKVSATDSFFELGGTSLTATRVIIEAKNRGYEIAYSDVFKNPTPQQLAKLTRASQKEYADPEVTDYDYTAIDALLRENNLGNFRSGERLPLMNVVLTGANGYLGIHILHDLLENHLMENPLFKVYCLVRHARNGVTSEARLRNLLFYYFEKSYKDMFGSQLIVIDGDVTSSEAFAKIEEQIGGEGPNYTLINCAAIVKHFSEGTEIEDINVGGLRNCVDFCLRTGARLIQTSTGSTAGQSVNGDPIPTTTLTEQASYIGQHLLSKYTHSKFLAERIVFESVITKGLTAKVIRLGNLAPRATDGEFQINFRSNSSMGRLHVFQMLGAIGYTSAEGTMEFSPIDEVARAVLLLSETPKECVAFHPNNNHRVILSDVVQEMATALGIDIMETEDEEFQNRLASAAQDPEKAKILQSMLAYSGGKDKVVYLSRDNSYTTQVLARLGFHWNMTSWDYISRFIQAIAQLDFFQNKR